MTSAEREAAGDLCAARRYLGLAILARSFGDDAVKAHYLARCLEARRAWHRSRRRALNIRPVVRRG